MKMPAFPQKQIVVANRQTIISDVQYRKDNSTKVNENPAASTRSTGGWMNRLLK